MKLKRFFVTERQTEPWHALTDGYATWREESAAVAESYRGWDRAEGDERWLAYAAYIAALDREERAACAYRRLVEEVQTG